MSEIPKIARARLQRQESAGAGNHPDADQMTAFVERSLGAREREQVLEHLARCAECREVVAVSLPPEEAARLVQPAPGFRWLEWQTLRWAAVAATATFVIAVTLVFQTYREEPQTASRETAQNQPAAVTAPAPAEAKQAEPTRADEIQPRQEAAATKEKASSSSAVVAVRDQDKETTNGPSKLDSVTRAKTAQKSGEMAGVSGGRMDDSKKLGSVGKVEAGGTEAVSVSAAAPVVTAAEAKPGPSAPAAQQQQVAGLAQQAPPSPPATMDEAHGQPVAAVESRMAAGRTETVEVTAQNETVTVEKDSAKRARNAAPAREYDADGRLSKAAATMRWIITSEGRVQRSVDNDQTWKSVALDKHIRFRAVSATGSEVWAGGEGGALYHSSDSGNHWTRVPLPAEIASATIVRLEFTDAEHGTLAISSGESWATSDGGETWGKN